MARSRKPDSERLTEYFGIPVSPNVKREVEAAARKAGTKPVPMLRSEIERIYCRKASKAASVAK